MGQGRAASDVKGHLRRGYLSLMPSFEINQSSTSKSDPRYPRPSAATETGIFLPITLCLRHE